MKPAAAGLILLALTGPVSHPPASAAEHRVVAIGDAGDRQGVAAATDFFTSGDAKRPAEIVQRRGVDRVLFCALDDGGLFGRSTDNPNALVHRLSRGDPPPWLAPRAARAGGFTVYDVDREAILLPDG